MSCRPTRMRSTSSSKRPMRGRGRIRWRMASAGMRTKLLRWDMWESANEARSEFTGGELSQLPPLVAQEQADACDAGGSCGDACCCVFGGDATERDHRNRGRGAAGLPEYVNSYF